MRNLLFLSFILFLFSECAKPDGPEKVSQKSYKDVCAGYDIVDKEMLDVIDQIESEYKVDNKFLPRFRDEQVYWIQYRERHLRALYPEDWDRFYRKNYGKQVFNTCKCQELIRKTEERVTELKMYLKANSGPDSQLDCPSSWNKKSAQ